MEVDTLMVIPTSTGYRTGNRGEWSELYIFFRLVSDGKIFFDNKKINTQDASFLPIVKIIRDEKSGRTTESKHYILNGDVKIISRPDDCELANVSVKEFSKAANVVLNSIKKGQKQPSGSFSIPEIEKFLKKVHIDKIKMDSKKKRDISLVVYDPKTGLELDVGFSIKSKLGGSSTLLNASTATNFFYRVDGSKIDKKITSKINSIETRTKIRDRYKKITDYGNVLEFEKVGSSVFESNMALIDSSLPQIVSEMLKKHFSGTASEVKILSDLLTRENPCSFNMEAKHPFYEYKIKAFLKEVALGMVPTSVWKGKHDATGGYLVVESDGSIVCYYLHNMNEFENYLFLNTKLETASSTRHNFGKVEQDTSGQIFKLNLQIRF